MRIAMAAFAALALSVAVAGAQTGGPDTEGGRFVLRSIDDGVLRMDRETGETSVCREDASGWACRVVPDNRSALEAEISRLAEENASLARRVDALQQQLAALGEAERATPDEPQAGEGEETLDLPSEAELDRIMRTFKSMMRRFLDMVRGLKEDYETGRI